MTDPQLLAEFERRFTADHDPWDFDSSDYERSKRQATVSACGRATGRRVLELGAANGVLAAELAPIAAELVAVEAVPAAAALARERLVASPQARVVEGLIPDDVPGGPWDLVVASEILYYLNEPAYERTLAAVGDWLSPNGRLVAVHWRPTSAERPRSAADVHRDLARHARLALVERHDTDDYLLAAFASAPEAPA